jgi:BNR repeat-like domain/BNR/Asp-box repeat
MNSNASMSSLSRQRVRSVLAVAALAALGLSPALTQAQSARAGRLDVNLDLLTFRASAQTPYTPGCSGTPDTGTLYTNAEVEPFASVNPRYPLNVIGVWQQDRWSNGGSRGLGTGYSFDGGITWKRVFPPFSRCAGGKADNNGDYERATDPWVSFSPNGVAHQMALSFDDAIVPGKPASAMLASRSTDGGRTWSKSVVLVADTEERFNDKNAMTADPTDSRYVYAVWDRLSFVAGEGAGPLLFARSIDNGRSWEPTRIVFDPGENAQTIGARIEVLPNGSLINMFTLIDFVARSLSIQVILSNDKGATWSAPVKVADLLTVGITDPESGAAVRTGDIIPQIAISRGGTATVVWQDARFSGGARDGIAASQSSDGGLTWSAPVQINGDPLAPAFTASVHVRRDGTVGVTYHDFRSNTADPATLPTDTWLVRSRDGVTWRESRVSKPFDMAKAPVAGGLFVGDYQGLVSIGPVFIPFFAKTTAGDDTTNRNDVFSHFALTSILRGAARGDASVTRQVEDEEAAMPVFSVQGTGQAVPAVSAEWRQRGLQNAERAMRDRMPAWAQQRQPKR